MSPSYKELLAQQKELDARIAAARESELADALFQVRSLVAQFDLKEADVFGSGRRRAPGRAPRTGSVAIKYRDPATGATWTGRGKAPRWIANQERTRFMV